MKKSYPRFFVNTTDLAYGKYSHYHAVYEENGLAYQTDRINKNKNFYEKFDERWCESFTSEPKCLVEITGAELALLELI